MKEMQEMQVQSLDREDPLEKEWQPIPVFLPGKSMDKGTWWVTVHGVTELDTSTKQQHPNL